MGMQEYAMEMAGTSEGLSARLFRMEPKIRYVAVNQAGRIVEMAQSPLHPSYNSCETDRIEELIVNPVVLELAARRGNLERSEEHTSELQSHSDFVCRFLLGKKKTLYR